MYKFITLPPLGIADHISVLLSHVCVQASSYLGYCGSHLYVECIRVEEGTKDTTLGDPVQVTDHAEDMFTNTCDICFLNYQQSTKQGHAED